MPSLTQPDSAFLVLIQAGEQKGFYPLSNDVVTSIGRSPENTIPLHDDRCSRNHASIFYENGEWCVEDKGSRNGTAVDDRVIHSMRSRLYPGCRLQIGHSVLLFGCGDPLQAETSIDEAANSIESDTATSLRGGTGMYGVNGEHLPAPADEDFHSTVIHSSGVSSFVERVAREQGQRQAARTTRQGFGSAELCQLAYSLGKAEEVEQVAKIVLEGLLEATGASAAGLWLFPYSQSTAHQASDVRLIASVTANNTVYQPISGPLVSTVIERSEALLATEKIKSGNERPKIELSRHHTAQGSFSEGGSLNNTLAAPIRNQNQILGLIHLYSTTENSLELGDLDYTLAVADTVAVALNHVHRQKELADNLNKVQSENSTLREMLKIETEIIGISPPMKLIGHMISRAAEGKATLLIRGESGSGKELVARAVHLASNRRMKPLVCLNCAAISESLLASELFGHEKGSFTGATERKIGKFEAANGGTLFLDEIGEMSQALQAKFLRVLEGHPFERVGGNTPITVDARVIAATNRDLEREVADGRFRHDLFFRLRVLEIIVPPLRKRHEDIPILASYFLDKFSKETGRKYQGFASEAMDTLLDYSWPGNIRELKNVVERAVVLSTGPYIQQSDLLLTNLNTTSDSSIQQYSASPANVSVFDPISLDEMEKHHIIKTLEYFQWNKSLVAKNLGIERTTLDRKIKRYGIDKSE